MLNIFVNSTTFGQALGATFDLSREGNLVQKRLTDTENCNVLDSIYERQLDTAKITEYSMTGRTKEIYNLTRAIDTENVRVNSLAVLIRELKMIESLGTNDMLIAYVPEELLRELESGKVKFQLVEDGTATTSSYYSDLERALWKEALPLIGSMYHRLVFKNIKSCKANANNSPEQAHRANICGSMYSLLLKAYRETKIARAQTVTGGVTTDTSAFA